jgi:hypothetical protein
MIQSNPGSWNNTKVLPITDKIVIAFLVLNVKVWMSDFMWFQIFKMFGKNIKTES